MYCPNCGTSIPTKHNFCRSCGMNVDSVARSVAIHRLLPDEGEFPTDTPKSRELNQVARMGKMLFGGISVMFLGALLLVLNKRMVQVPEFGMVATFIVIGGVLLAAYAVISPMWQQSAPARPKPEPSGRTTSEMAAPVAQAALPPPEPFSVVEETTRKLETSPVKRK